MSQPQASAAPQNRQAVMMDFIGRTGWAGAELLPLAGDASFRRYIRLRRGEKSAMLMDAPPAQEDVRPYVSVCRHLHGRGYSAPDIFAADEAEGFVLSEDLGDALYTRVIAAGMHEKELYRAAVDVLVRWQDDAAMRKSASPLTLPDYDEAVYLREAALLSEWFLPAAQGEEQAKEAGEEYLSLWRRILAENPLACDIFVHRDYHADNLLWLPEREGAARVGQLDFQDALWGHPAYDLISLLEDARRDVDPRVAEEALDYYLAQTGVERERFTRDMAVLAAQRNCKIIGIFVRLSRRDGKNNYLRYLPRVWAHLAKDLAHPALADLRGWFDTHVPESARVAI